LNLSEEKDQNSDADDWFCVHKLRL
jgi:hypothetical protein